MEYESDGGQKKAAELLDLQGTASSWQLKQGELSLGSNEGQVKMET